MGIANVRSSSRPPPTDIDPSSRTYLAAPKSASMLASNGVLERQEGHQELGIARSTTTERSASFPGHHSPTALVAGRVALPVVAFGAGPCTITRTVRPAERDLDENGGMGDTTAPEDVPCTCASSTPGARFRSRPYARALSWTRAEQLLAVGDGSYIASSLSCPSSSSGRARWSDEHRALRGSPLTSPWPPGTSAVVSGRMRASGHWVVFSVLTAGLGQSSIVLTSRSRRYQPRWCSRLA